MTDTKPLSVEERLAALEASSRQTADLFESRFTELEHAVASAIAPTISHSTHDAFAKAREWLEKIREEVFGGPPGSPPVTTGTSPPAPEPPPPPEADPPPKA